MLACDACESYMDLCEKYNCEYLHSQTRVGYPTQPYGYSKSGMIDWITRFYIASLRSNSKYIIMFEDDIVITRKLTLPKENQFFDCANYDSEHRKRIQLDYRFPDRLMNLIKENSGVYPNVDFYGCGGGSIFPVEMINKNYNKMVDFINNSGDEVFSFYPFFGWIDCFMTIYGLLSGYEYIPNEKITNLYREDWDAALVELSEEYEIITHFKKYY